MRAEKVICILFWFFTVLSPAQGQFLLAGDYGPIRERLTLSADREVYSAGECVYLALAVESDSPGSKLAYVDLVNRASGITVGREKIALGQVAPGQFRLDDSLASGSYLLRAYTRNIGPDHAAEKELQIINTNSPKPNFLQKRTAAAGEKADSLELMVNQQQFSFREPVSIALKAPAELAIGGEISLSVYLEDSLQANAGLPELARSSDGYLPDKQRIPGHIYAERNGEILTGTITRRNGGAPLNTVVYLCLSGRNPHMLCQKSATGRFLFELPRFAHPANLVLLAREQDYQISIDGKQTRVEADPSGSGSMWPVPADELQLRHIAKEVSRAFNSDSLSPLNPGPPDSNGVFGPASEVVFLDDYTRFHTLEEVFREFVKTVMVRKKGDTLHLHCLDLFDSAPKFMEEDPLVLVDGIPVLDNKALFDIDPLRIRKVSVLARRFYDGPAIFSGVVSMETYAGDLAGIKLDENALVTDFEGEQVPLKFYSPNYAAGMQENRPDQRLTLFWSPKLDLSSSQPIRFFTGDIPGRYRVVAMGISPGGKPWYGNTWFEVRPKIDVK